MVLPPRATGLLVRWGVIVLFVAFYSLFLRTCGWRAGYDAGAAKLGEVKAEHQTTLQRIAALTEDAKRKARAAKAAIERESAQADDTYNRGMADGIASLETTLAGLQRGTLQLRSDLARRCPGPAGVPDATGTTSGGDGAGAAGLSIPDAEFLVRESARADDVVRQLTLCQAYARAVSTPRE